MAIKEFKSFFLRNTVVNGGAEPDQEVGFPTQYFVTIDGIPTQKYNRFLKNHFPSENVFRKLFDSIPFFLNKESTANYNNNGEQGLVKATLDADAISRTSRASATDKMTVLQPHQMVEVVTSINGLTDVIDGAASIVNGLTLTKYIRTVGGLSRQIYLLQVPTVNEIKHQILHSITTTTNNGTGVTQYDWTAEEFETQNLLLIDGNELEFEADFVLSTVSANSVYKMQVKFGAESLVAYSAYSVGTAVSPRKVNIKGRIVRLTQNTQKITWESSVTWLTSPSLFVFVSNNQSINGSWNYTRDLTASNKLTASVEKFDLSNTPANIGSATECVLNKFMVKITKQ